MKKEILMEKYKSLDKRTKRIVVYVLLLIVFYVSSIIMIIRGFILRMIFY